MRRAALGRIAMAWSRHATVSCMTTAFVILISLNAMSSSLRCRKALQVTDAIERDLAIHAVRCNAALFRAGLEHFGKRPAQEWSLTDCISYRVMESTGITDAFTGDAHFEQAGCKALLRPSPPAN